MVQAPTAPVLGHREADVMGFNCCDFTVLPALTLQVVQGNGARLVAKGHAHATYAHLLQGSLAVCVVLLLKGCKGLKSNS